MDKKSSKKKLEEFLKKIKKIKEEKKFDLSSDEDLSIAIMNLISIEEHLFFTYKKTNDPKYLQLLYETREMRKSALKEIIKDYEGEVWCISKHLLAASMRFMEVGTKYLNQDKKDKAKEMFDKSYKLYTLFWGLNLGLIKTKDVKKTESKKIDILSEGLTPQVKDSISIFAKLSEFLKKAVDCCKE